MKIDRTIRAGDILTSLVIFVSVIALMASWSQDRYLRQKEQADRVRNAAAVTLAKLERWQTISLSIFHEAQPIFVETSELLAKDFDIISVWDFLWKKLNEARTKTLARILQEEIEIAYIDLYGYHPGVRDLFLSTIEKLENEEQQIFQNFVNDTQEDVLSFEDKSESYTTAHLGNALRTTAGRYRKQHEEKMRKTLKPIDEFLSKLILRTDKDILRQRLITLP